MSVPRAAPVVIDRMSILTANDDELRVMAAGIVAAVLATLGPCDDQAADRARRHPDDEA